MLAAGLMDAVERDLSGARIAVRTTRNGNVVTLVVEAEGGGQDAHAMGAAILRAAAQFDAGENGVTQARGSAVNRARTESPAVWLDRLALFARGGVDPRAVEDYAARLRGVPAERVRLLASTLLDATRASVVEVGGAR